MRRAGRWFLLLCMVPVSWPCVARAKVDDALGDLLADPGVVSSPDRATRAAQSQLDQ